MSVQPGRPLITPTAPAAARTHTISVYVTNKPGVLVRIGLVFARRGYNIESFIVSPGAQGGFSRSTITCTGDAEVLEQIIQQLRKLVDVVHATDHTDMSTYETEIALIKVAVSAQGRAELLQLAEHLGAKVVDLHPESLILRVHGSSEKLDHFVELLRSYELLELVRTGKIVMARGAATT